MNTDLISRADAEALFRTARSKLNPSDYKTADEFNTRDLMLLNAEQMIHLLPSVTPQEPKASNSENPNKCEDCISRQAAIDAIGKDVMGGLNYAGILTRLPSVAPKYTEITLESAIDYLNSIGWMQEHDRILTESAQNVTPKQRTGHWILRDDINGQYQCDECGMFSGLSKFDVEEAGWKLSNFCSKCGAKMV